ncbi:hypothetical protein [Loktanella salsilacus]|uniref:hypothetical protein n=1 Tax=Loktanella salsilacus TaxID=195913 RepID=UPI0020B6882E|nr:hypothetical protein [Loktanella salsilacus]UTH43899.1 hypothetical protein KBK07_12485 [Loktanella salsilacus]
MKLVTFIALFGLAACQTTTESVSQSSAVVADLKSTLSGKTLTHPDVTLLVSANGQLSGTESDGTNLVGTWTILDGQWCRTLTAPASFAGTACQDVSIAGDQATFTRAGGSSITFTIS